MIRWRKRKFREFWRKKSQRGSGRPAIPGEHIEFIRRISSDHPEYGEDRFAVELEVKFGIHHASSTVRRYMVKRCPPSDSQAWRSFLKNQAKAMWICDFFVQHTIGFRVLYVFIIMELSSRKLIHFNVTENPTLEWTKQQVRNGRVHQALNGIPDPDPTLAEPKPVGARLVAIPVLNGLHHDYRIVAQSPPAYDRIPTLPPGVARLLEVRERLSPSKQRPFEPIQGRVEGEVLLRAPASLRPGYVLGFRGPRAPILVLLYLARRVDLGNRLLISDDDVSI